MGIGWTMPRNSGRYPWNTDEDTENKAKNMRKDCDACLYSSVLSFNEPCRSCCTCTKSIFPNWEPKEEPVKTRIINDPCLGCLHNGKRADEEPCQECGIDGEDYFEPILPLPSNEGTEKEEKTMPVKEEAPMPISEVVRDILNSLEVMDINLHGIESAIMGGDSDEVALKEAAPNRNGLNNDIHLIANAVYNLNSRITALRAIL